MRLGHPHDWNSRKRITRFIVVVWQAAIPPGFCAIALVIKYMVFTETHPVRFIFALTLALASGQFPATGTR